MSEWQTPQYKISTSTSCGPGSRRSKLKGSRREVGLLAAYPRVGNIFYLPCAVSFVYGCVQLPEFRNYSIRKKGLRLLFRSSNSCVEHLRVVTHCFPAYLSNDRANHATVHTERRSVRG